MILSNDSKQGCDTSRSSDARDSGDPVEEHSRHVSVFPDLRGGRLWQRRRSVPTHSRGAGICGKAAPSPAPVAICLDRVLITGAWLPDIAGPAFLEMWQHLFLAKLAGTVCLPGAYRKTLPRSRQKTQF